MAIVSGLGVGLIVGLIVGITGEGRGSRLTPRLPSLVQLILRLQARMRAPDTASAGNSHAEPLTLVAGPGHARHGNAHGKSPVSLRGGLPPGIWLGAQPTRHLPGDGVRSLLHASLPMAGWKVIH